MRLFGSKTATITADEALRGRETSLPVAPENIVLHHPMRPPFPDGLQVAVFGMGCFWGAERIFWQLPGVWTTSVGYAGGYTPNPTYEEVCSGRTAQAEVAEVVYDPAVTSYEALLQAFWENHNPTTMNRQGNDVGSQYRSLILTTTPEQAEIAETTKKAFQPVVTKAGFGEISTEIAPLGDYYFAEDYHQQYLFKNPGGYCNHGPNGLSCPVGIARQDELPAQQDLLKPQD